MQIGKQCHTVSTIKHTDQILLTTVSLIMQHKAATHFVYSVSANLLNSINRCHPTTDKRSCMTNMKHPVTQTIAVEQKHIQHLYLAQNVRLVNYIRHQGSSFLTRNSIWHRTHNTEYEKSERYGCEFQV